MLFVTSLSKEDLDEYLTKGWPLEFGHSLTDLYEDLMSDSPLGKYHPNYIATRGMKM